MLGLEQVGDRRLVLGERTHVRTYGFRTRFFLSRGAGGRHRRGVDERRVGEHWIGLLGRRGGHR
ncbi:hypothetical protein GCM10010492_14540 [Saccharothrix mutabilis subsp. mutabilis]|uniref:Uncharacterized protein n=1 Tax=Saccharothrix mutabilis subsp. mutabilis TaxID=66855 RepID=A0ABN0TBY7_9PSEU